MADPNPGLPTTVRRTPIYVDDQGRRRRADDSVAPFPQNQDDTTKAMQARIAALEKLLADYIQKNDARTITGGGSVFSGTLGSGIKFNPNAAGGKGGGGISGEFYPLELCDGTTLDVLAQNIVPP